MQIEIVQEGRVLRRITYRSKNYIEVPGSGRYEIRLTNNCPRRRLAVVSVDGLNVNDGNPASHDGSGYVLSPWQSITLKGWLRSNSEVAAFEFGEQEQSYSAQTGHGTRNVGVVGVAVFDEKENPRPFVVSPWPTQGTTTWPTWWTSAQPMRPQVTWSGEPWTVAQPPVPEPSLICETPGGSTGTMSGYAGVSQTLCSTGAGYSAVATNGATGRSLNATATPNLGTGYGARTIQYTSITTFERATTSPSLVLSLRYAVRAKLEEWGVLVDMGPEPFPAAATGFAQPPPGWSR